MKQQNAAIFYEPSFFSTEGLKSSGELLGISKEMAITLTFVLLFAITVLAHVVQQLV
jgi:hypothetical protein